MTTNIFSVLNEGKQALLTHQLAIEVTGNNVANVQTPGYTRQTVNLESNTPRFIGLGQVGTGVRVDSITRNFDQFLFNQLLGEGSPMGAFSTRNSSFQRLELLFNETTGPSVGGEISNFFTAFQDLASNPSGLPERSALAAQANSLASTFNTTGQAIFQEQQNLDQVVQDTVAEINSILSGITALNLTIHQNETTASPANDLRDQRDVLVKELSGLIDITLVDEQNNQVRLTLSDGTPLVLGNRSFALSTRPNGDNKGFRDVFIDDGAGGVKDITNFIAGGELRGLLDMRDREVPAIKDQFDRLAGGLIREVNRLHQAGFGLDGGTGVNFFAPIPPTVRPSVQNTGTAVVTMTSASATTASIDRFQMQFTGAGSFDLVNLTTGQASGSFTFTSGTVFNLANGLAVTVTGTAAAGDVVNFSVSEDAATRMSLEAAVSGNPLKIAAGLNGPGDGANAARLAQLQNQLVFDGNTLVAAGSGAFTFNEFFTSLVGGIGVDARSAQALQTTQEGLMLQLTTRRESISGVSIDEEMVNLIKFQQAFAAAARLINIAEEMLDILANRI